MDRSKWEYKKLGEVCKSINAGGTPSRGNSAYWNGDIPWVKIKDMNSKYVKSTEEFITEEGLNNSSAKLFEPGTILYSIFATIGAASILEIPATTNQAIAGIVLGEGCDRDFYYYYLTSLRSHFENISKGVAQNNINLSVLRNQKVVVPPISDQQRIVAELDCLNEMIAVKQEQLKEFDKLAQSIFYDMFGDPVENTHGWYCDILANLVSEDCSISYGIVQPGDDVEDGVPVVRPVDLTSSVVYRKGLKVVDKAISDSYKRTILKGNELLFCVRGTTGIMSFASEELKGCNVTRGITPLLFSEKVNRIYVYYLLATPYLQNIIAEKTNGIALKQINMRDVRQLPILLPPLSLQQQFAEKISAIEAQKELVKQSIAETQHLLDYTMDKYFG